MPKIRKLWVITKPGLEKVWALRIKKGCVSILTQPQNQNIMKSTGLLYQALIAR